MEEHFDVCTPDGVPTGQSVPRSQAHREGLWHRSSHLWVMNRRGQMLLQRRHPGKETDPGRWDIAVAGHLSAGQTPVQALVREALEELGLVLDPAELAFLEARPKVYVEPTFVDREWQHAFACLREVDLATLVLQADEVVDVRWMDGDAYEPIARGGHPDYVARQEDWPAFDAWRQTVLASRP